MSGCERYEPRRVALQSGDILDDAFIVYATHGTLNADASNAIVLNTPFAASHDDVAWMIGPGRALDPRHYFIVIPNLIGNGVSVSPSTMGGTFTGPFPRVTIHDNVMLQERLLREELGVGRIQLAVGFSMGGQQAFHWGALFPGAVERIAPICSSARTSRHNFVFLESLKAALTADPAWREGWFHEPPERGLQALARGFAAWALSPAFYRDSGHAKLGFETLEAFLEDCDANMLKRNANDIMSMLWSWQYADISTNERFGGDLEKALRAIACKALVMPSETDCYFTLDDIALEVGQMPNAELRPIPSIWGHRAGNPIQNEADAEFINTSLRAFLTD